MRRIIEKLVQQRKEKEADFSKKLEEIKEKSKEFHDIKGSLRFQQLFSSLEEILEPKGKEYFISTFSKPVLSSRNFSVWG